jgi:hypothetical protein
MFKWICLGVAVVFLSLFAWILYDVRVLIHETSEIVKSSGKTINEQLPTIVEKTRKTTDTLADHLPQIVEKTQKSTETLAELAEDIRQLKELAGVSNTVRDKSLLPFADGILDAIDASGGMIGVKKTFGSGLKSTQTAKEWVVGARKEALFLTAVARSRKELLTRLSENKFGSSWYIQIKDAEPVTLAEWLKAHHPAAKELE